MAKLPKLGRRAARREPKRRFTLFCEGRNTEPDYFAALDRAFRSALVELKIVPGVGVPGTIAEKAADHVRPRRRRKDSFEANDEAWAVFDRDEHPGFNDAVARCESLGISVARSDPCFELWLILHERDYDQPCGRRQVQRALEQSHPEYDRQGAKTLDCDALMARIGKAEDRAEAQLRRRGQEGKPCGNPSTTVGHLTRAVRKADAQARP